MVKYSYIITFQRKQAKKFPTAKEQQPHTHKTQTKPNQKNKTPENPQTYP